MNNELGNSRGIVIAAQVLFYFGLGGYPAGGFFDLIYQAIQKADSGNMTILMKAYPEETAAMHLVMYGGQRGIDKLKDVAQGRSRLIPERRDVGAQQPTEQSG